MLFCNNISLFFVAFRCAKPKHSPLFELYSATQTESDLAQRSFSCLQLLFAGRFGLKTLLLTLEVQQRSKTMLERFEVDICLKFCEGLKRGKTSFLSFQLAAKLSGNGNFTALIVKASSSRKLVLSNQQYLKAYSRTEAPDSCSDLEDYFEADEKQEFSTLNCPDQSSNGKLFDRCGWRLSKFKKVWSCLKSQNNEMVSPKNSLIIKKRTVRI